MNNFILLMFNYFKKGDEKMTMTKCKCGYCNKTYNEENHKWCAGHGCSFYCSRECCIRAWERQGDTREAAPPCPCY